MGKNISVPLSKMVPGGIPKLNLPPKSSRKIDWKQLYQDGTLKKIVNPLSGDVYTITAYLGAGTYGFVFRASNLKLGDIALKLFNIIDNQDADFKAELESYTYLSHMPSCQKHIVCLYDSFVIPDLRMQERPRSSAPRDGLEPYGTPISVGVGVYELMDGDLSHEGITDDEVPFLIVDLLDGLDFIHRSGFAHRDIKPANLLMKRNGTEDAIFKMGDLGLTCSDIAEDTIEECEYFGTQYYLSPEALQHWQQKATLEEAQDVDIWMLGVSFYQIIFLRAPFPSSLEFLKNLTQDQIDDLLNPMKPYPRQENDLLSSYDIIFLLSQMMQVDPTKRSSTSELLDYVNMIVTSKERLLETEEIASRTTPSGPMWTEPEELPEFPSVPKETPLLPEESVPCDPLLSRFNARQLIRELEKAILDRIRNNTVHYKVHTDNIRAIQKSKCIDEAYLDTIYKIYHDDVLVRSAMGKPDNLIFLGDLALSHLDHLRSASPKTQALVPSSEWD